MDTNAETAVQIFMDDEDFQRLWDNAMSWADVDSWAEQVMAGRFECTDGNCGAHDVHVPELDWRYIYFLPDDWTSVILAKSFLRARGEKYEVFRDLVGAESGEGHYSILTNYAARIYQRSEDREANGLWGVDFDGLGVHVYPYLTEEEARTMLTYGPNRVLFHRESPEAPWEEVK